MYQNKHRNTVSDRTEFIQQDRHTLALKNSTDLKNSANLQHLGVYFTSGDKVLYTPQQNLFSQKHTLILTAEGFSTLLWSHLS